MTTIPPVRIRVLTGPITSVAFTGDGLSEIRLQSSFGSRATAESAAQRYFGRAISDIRLRRLKSGKTQAGFLEEVFTAFVETDSAALRAKAKG